MMFKNSAKVYFATVAQKHPGILRPESMQDVVIACISGRGGVSPPSGIERLRNRLRDNLRALGVPDHNIFSRSWNHNRDDDPFSAPWVEDLHNEIKGRSSYPSYLGIVGHSYGGWAACKVSRVTAKVPDFVGLIDPVFGASNSMGNDDYPRGVRITNWFQNNSIVNGDTCTGAGKVPCSKREAGLSCGYSNVAGAENILEEFMKDWNAGRKRVPCVGGRRHVLTSHTEMDDNDYIHRQIVDRILEGMHKMNIINLAELDVVGTALAEAYEGVEQQATPKFTHGR